MTANVETDLAEIADYVRGEMREAVGSDFRSFRIKTPQCGFLPVIVADGESPPRFEAVLVGVRYDYDYHGLVCLYDVTGVGP